MTACVNIKSALAKNVQNYVNKFIHSFLVSYGSIRLKLSDNEASYIIKLSNDLEELFPGNKFLRDAE